MKKQIETLITKLEAMLERASDLSDSENEKTSDKYTNIAEIIEEVLSSLQEAIDILEG